MLKKLTFSSLLLLFLLKVAQAQFHPSITPVLRSTNISIGPFLIEEPNHLVAGAGDMWLGVVDTITKEIIHDTSYFDPGCPFGANGMGFIAKHPKGGYISSGILDECGRSIAIVLWTDTAMNEIASYKAPYHGYQETEASFINATVDPETGLTYAIKFHNQPLQTSDDKPVVLYTFDDSLNVLRQDTLAMENRGVRFDIDITKKILIYDVTPNDWNSISILKGINLNTYKEIFSNPLPKYTTVDAIKIDRDFMWIGKSYFGESGIGYYGEANAYLQKLDLNGLVIDSVHLSSPGIFSTIRSGSIHKNQNKLYYTFFETGETINSKWDTIFIRDVKMLSISDELEVLKRISLTHGNYREDSISNGYFITPFRSSRVKNNFLYYRVNLRIPDSAKTINFLNRIDLSLLTSSQADNLTATQSTIKSYPNPARDVLYVDYPTYMLEDKPTYQLIDLSGRVLVSGNLAPAIPLTKLPKGTFILHIKNSQHRLLADPQLFIHL